MKRLTRKIKGANNYCEFELKDQPYKSFLDIKRNSDLEWLDVCDLTLAIDKLGQLEDIEKELGIDLITLLKALKEGVYYKTIKSVIYHIPDTCLELNYNFGEFTIWVNGHKMLDGLLINLKKYGKTWALNKEELENE